MDNIYHIINNDGYCIMHTINFFFNYEFLNKKNIKKYVINLMN